MFFRNLTMFRFPAPLDFSALADLLPHCGLKPVGPLELHSRGFVSPYGGLHKEVLLHQDNDAIWVTVGSEDKILPPAVIDKALQDKLDEIEKAEGRVPGGRARKRLKDDLLHELMPKAFVKPGRVNAVLDLQTHVIMVDTASRKTAEGVVSDIRGALGSFPAMPLNAEVAPCAVLTRWLASNELPDGLALGNSATLVDPGTPGSTVKLTELELISPEVNKHLDAGRRVSRLELVFQDRLSFTIGDDLVLRKVKFLDGALDQLEDTQGEGRAVEIDARFFLMTGEFRALFLVLEKAFSLSAAEA